MTTEGLAPVDLLTSMAAGSKTSPFWVTRELVSVVAPGIVVLCELSILIRPSAKAVLTSPLSSGGEPGLLVGLVLVIGLAWVIGYISRETAFKGLRFTEPRRPAEEASESGGDPSGNVVNQRNRFRDWLDGFRSPQQSPAQLRKQLTETYGTAVFADFLRTHPVVDGFMTSEQIYNRRSLGGDMPDDASTAIFMYCKLWLRRNAPDLGVENIELEINIVASAVIPVLFLPVVVAFGIAAHWIYWLAVSILICVYLLGQLARSYRRLRGSERWEAVSNVILVSTWQRTEASEVEPPPGPTGRPAGPGTSR